MTDGNSPALDFWISKKPLRYSADMNEIDAGLRVPGRGFRCAAFKSSTPNHNSLAVIVGLRASTKALVNLSCTFGAMASRVLRTDNWDQIRCREVKSAYACPDESRRSRSMLNGYSVQLASTKAPPLAENTEKSRGRNCEQ